MASSHNITQLLIDWSRGDREALEKLVPLVERELHRLAKHYIRRERPGHLLQTTALVNEAYIGLIDQSRVQWQNRAHFFGIAAQIMHRILLNYARAQRRLKRGGQVVHVDLDPTAILSAQESEEIIALHEALQHLASLDARKCQVVELRYFGGLTVEEIAEVLGVSSPTIARDWDFAKSWLRREMQK